MADTTLDIRVLVSGGSAASAEIKQVSAATTGVGTATEQTTKKTGVLRSALGAVGGALAVYKGYSFVKSAVSQTESLAKATAGLQRITGMDVQTASGWVSVAKERDISAKQLNLGFVSLGRNMAAAGKGSKASVQAFNELGISQRQLAGMNTQQTLSAVADGLQKLPPSAEKAALAQKLLGRSGQSLLPLLNGGSKAMNDQVAAMGKTVGMTKNSVTQGLKLAAQQRELNAATTGVKVAIGTALIPVLLALAKVITPIAQGFATLMQHSAAFRIALYALLAAMTTWLVLSKALALAGLEVDAAWLLIPAAIVGIGVALVMLYNKCAWFRNAVNAVFSAVAAGVNWIKNAAVATFNWIKNNWPLLLTIIAGPLGAAVALAIKHFGTIKSIATGALNAVKSAAQAMGSVFSSVFGAMKSAVDAVVGSIRTLISTAQSIAKLPGKALKVLGGAASSVGNFVTGHQHGGVVRPGGELALVGEAGPEILSLPGGTRVTPNNAIGAFGGGGVVHTHVYLEGREIAHAMGNYVAGQQASR